MTDLLDIAPEETRETVEVLGKSLEVKAITLGQLARLLRRFPTLNAKFKGVNTEAGPDDDLETLEFIPPAIAAACGHFGEANYEAVAERLPLDAQIKIFNVIMRLTMPERGPLGQGPAIGPALQADTPPANGSLAPLSN